MSVRTSLKHTLLLAGLCAGALSILPRGALADDAQVQSAARVITTHGEGEVRVRPDSLRTDVGVEAAAATLEDARTQVDTTAQHVVDAIHALRVPDLVIETSALQFTPVYADHTGTAPPAITGYRVSNHLTITVRGAAPDDLGDRAARIIDAAVTAGANTVSGISFFLTDPESAQGSALTAAVVVAERDAQTIATAAGVTIVELLSLEVGAGSRVQPSYFALDARAFSAPIEVGENTVQSSVTARFLFK